MEAHIVGCDENNEQIISVMIRNEFLIINNEIYKISLSDKEGLIKYLNKYE